MKILIIEDETQLTNNILKYLKQENFLCETVRTVEDANEKLLSFVYDCVILDISLPDGNGLTILQEMKEMKRNDGIIIMSARHSIDDKIHGFNLGADDYLPKPFHLAELSARVNAIIRRRQFDGHSKVEVDGLVLDFSGKVAFYEDNRIDLTKTEFDLLSFFISNKNRVVTKQALAEHITTGQNELYDKFDFVYTHLKNLKRKLLNGGCGERIRSIYGIGYKFVN